MKNPQHNPAQDGVGAGILTDESNLPDLTPYIRDGDTVMWGQAAAEPLTLTRALIAQRQLFGRLKLFLGIGLSTTLSAAYADSFHFMSYCGAGSNRDLARAGVLDIFPCAYSTFPEVLSRRRPFVDVVLVQVSPADAHGNFSLGLANDLLIAAIQNARVVIAEVNPLVPRTFGARTLAAADINMVVPALFPPIETLSGVVSPVDALIARQVAGLIEDGATLQFGLGGVADATLSLLHDRKDLGVHSGIAGDGIVGLAESGALTNARKGRDAGISITGLLIGSRRLYDFADRNAALGMRGTDYTHGPEVLRSLNQFVAINSAIEVDLTGQVNSEVANGEYLGAVGGAPDFLRAAHFSRGGIPIVALPSLAGKRSRIVASLSGPVTTPRCDAGVIVTEHGVADLRGLSIAQRKRRMLDLAHPSQREMLEREAHSS
nr:acetyl-CoA hydrolase/transferase C-terminal domain-containing protein [Polaromonas glacialis]